MLNLTVPEDGNIENAEMQVDFSGLKEYQPFMDASNAFESYLKPTQQPHTFRRALYPIFASLPQTLPQQRCATHTRADCAIPSPLLKNPRKPGSSPFRTPSAISHLDFSSTISLHFREVQFRAKYSHHFIQVKCNIPAPDLTVERGDYFCRKCERVLNTALHRHFAKRKAAVLLQRPQNYFTCLL